jgi:hypothetical protein
VLPAPEAVNLIEPGIEYEAEVDLLVQGAHGVLVRALIVHQAVTQRESLAPDVPQLVGDCGVNCSLHRLDL